MNRILVAILSALTLASCGSRMEDAVDSSKTKIRSFLHGQKIYDPTGYPGDTEPAQIEGYYSIVDGAFVWTYNQNDADRNTKAEVRQGDMVLLWFDFRIFGSNFDGATTYYTNRAERINSIWASNTEFDARTWSTDPLIVTVGSNENLPKAVHKCLVGARLGDELRIFLPPDRGYGNKGEGIVPAYSTLALQIIVSDIIKE